MKKVLLILMGIALSSCSSSSSGSSDSPGDTSVSLISTIHIDENAYTPGTNNNTSSSVTVTPTETTNDGAANTTTFTFIQPTANIMVFDAINVVVVRPVSQSSISGTYSITAAEGATVNNNVSGNYLSGSSVYYFKSGAVSVTDLDHNNYKLIFNNVVVTNNPFGGGSLKTIAGTYQGNFVVE